ncbi:MAG: serine endopeptidase [Janthinobacterium lividum]
MRRSLRLSERWFHRGLWLVALLFAFCLVGLGSIVVDDLPRVERQAQRDDFLDAAAAQPYRVAVGRAAQAEDDATAAGEQAALRLQAAQQAYASAKDAFGNWLETRKATSLPGQDKDLVARTQGLDALNAARVEAQHAVDAGNQAVLDAQQARSEAQGRLDALESDAGGRLAEANSRAELRVFGYRLALTLPLLAVAGWLFARARGSTWWPFVWGFILFALFTFFVELVPYLPSYGGYVHYGVGLLLTVLVGRYTIVSLNRYLARQKAAEQMPDRVRRDELDYDTALARLAKAVCPGCERPIDLKDAANDFCPHCGIGVFGRCGHCATRRSAFARFCHACGTQAGAAAGA